MMYFFKLKLVIATLFITIGYKDILAQATVNAPKQYASTWRNVQVIRNLLNNQSKDQPIDFEDIKGSPYEYNSFKIGKVFLKDSLLGQFMLRFNSYTNELEVLSDKKDQNGKLTYDAFLKLDGLSFSIENTIYKLVDFTDGTRNSETKYLEEIINSGEHKLYAYRYTILTPAQKAVTFNEVDRAARFTTYTEFYVTKDGVLQQLPKKKKSFLAFFDNHNSAIKKFLKQQKFRLDDSKDLSKIIAFINTL